MAKFNAADGLARIDHTLTVWRHAETGFCLGTYDFVHRIAKGPFGESWHGRVSRSGEPVILRVMNARSLPRRGVQRSVSETIDRLSRLHHPSLVKTLGSETATAFTERATQRSIREGTMILVSAARPNFRNTSQRLTMIYSIPFARCCKASRAASSRVSAPQSQSR